MLKQCLIYFILSTIIVIFAKYAHLLVVYLDILYTQLNLQLVPLFSRNHAATLLRGVLILTLLPILVSGVPALIYRAVKGQLMPYFFETTWMIWLMIVISKIIII